MNIAVSHVRRVLSACYDPQEASALAKIVCCEMLGQSPTDFYMGKDITLGKEKHQELEDILRRLCNFEPIQYIQGVARFGGRDFRVTPAVLVPRPETEELTALVAAEAPAGARILDIGTGSGCIAVTLSIEVKEACVEGWDISSEALEVARLNARRLKAQVHFEQRDIFAPESEATASRYDIVVSNPPYVTEAEKADMERNVLDWEPANALFVPDDAPLHCYRRIATLGHKLLTGNGKLYLEINRAYGPHVCHLLQEEGYGETVLRKDFFGNDRFVIAKI